MKKQLFKSIKNSNKRRVLRELKEAVEELKLVKQGKLKGRPARELLEEL